MSKHALFLAIANKNPGKKLETVQKMLARANVDSLPMEMLEEGGSAGLHWMFDGEEFHLPSAGGCGLAVCDHADDGHGDEGGEPAGWERRARQDGITRYVAGAGPA